MTLIALQACWNRTTKPSDKKVLHALHANALPIVLGGDHSITLPSAVAVVLSNGYGKVGMVHFDAHADVGDTAYGGVLVSHAIPMRRLLKSGAITGKNFVQVDLSGSSSTG